ncbi:MAG: hypothetical protein QXJ63_00975 [Candidatus Bathyarchaeia archaeon]
MQLKKALVSTLLLAILAVSVGIVAVPVKAAISGSVAVTRPDMVVPGGAIQLEIPYADFSATGGTIYFYFSKNDDPEITSGDIRLTSIKRTDVVAEIEDDDLITIFVPTTVPAYEDGYYVKVSDSSTVGAGALVSDETVVVIPEEEWPTITVDPTSGTVPGTVDVEGEDILADWGMATAYLFWDDYEEPIGDPAGYSVNGEFTAEDVPIPEAFMGAHKILVLLENSDTLGAFVDFTVEPSVEVTPPADFSVEADKLNQLVALEAHGFPKGTIKANSIKYIVKDFVTGSTVDTITADHDEIDICETAGYEGTFAPDNATLDTTVHYVPEGTIDLQFKVDTKTFTISDALLSSATRDPGKFTAKMDVKSGQIGDKVKFSAIGFPANVSVTIIFEGDVVKDIVGEKADANGAWKYTYTLADLPGGKYTVKIKDVNNSRIKVIGTFEVLPSVTFYDAATDEDITSTHVEDEIYILGDGFPAGATIDTIVIGTGKVELDPAVEIDYDGLFDSGVFAVPHTSGGGKSVKVAIKGEDADGKALTIESSIVVDPTLQAIDVDEETGCLALNADGDWEEYTTATIFGGTVMKITGMGFLAGESVKITFSSETLDYEATATITDGGKADSDGDLEVVFQVPTGLKFSLDVNDWDIEVAGSTTTNKASVYDTYGSYVVVTGLDDTQAWLYFGLEADGDLDLTVNVGDTVRVVGVGFETRSLTLMVEDIEVKKVTSKYGYFDTTIVIPELQRGTYTLVEDATDAESGEWDVESKVTLSTSRAVPGATVTASGTGFLEDEDTDILWPGLPKLATATGDEDGSWTATFTVPDVSPGTYTITFDAEDLPHEDDPQLTFYVLGPLRIVSLSLPSEVYNGSSVTITVNVQDFFGMAVTGATVTGSVTPPGAAAASLTFAETASGIYSATYAVPATAKEGSYLVSVKASKPEAGGDATASGTFYVSLKMPPAPPVDISAILAAVKSVTKDVTALSGSVSKLSTDLSGLKSDVSALSSSVSSLSGDVSALSRALADLKSTVAAIPVIPIELIYAILIISIIAAIAAIAAIIFIYRKIAS